MKFYTVATNDNGNTRVIDADTQHRFEAEIDIRAKAKELGYVAGDIHPIAHTAKQGGVITKHFKERKKLRAQGKRTDSMF